jgi:O-antigen/teichoic acid export membrane protein
MPAPETAEDGRAVSDARAGRPEAQTTTTGGSSRRLLRDYLSMIGFNGLSIVLSFLNTSVLLSLLGREGYGEVVSLTMASQILFSLVAGWAAQTINRFGAEEFHDTGQVGATFWNLSAIVWSGVAAMLLTSPLWGDALLRLLASPRFGLTFLLIHFPLLVFWHLMQFTLLVTGRQRLLYPFFCLERLTILCTAVGLYLAGSLSVETMLPGYVFGTFAAAGTALCTLRRSIGAPRRPDRAKVAELARFSAPLAPGVWSNLLGTNALDYLFVKRFMGAAELGVYALGVQIAGLFQQLPIVASQLMSPQIVKWRLQRDAERLEKFVRRQFFPMLCVWCAGGVAAAALVAWLGPDYVPEKYRLLTKLAWPLAASTAIVPLWSLAWIPLLVAFERVRVILAATVVSGTINVAANLTLIPRYGAVGSGWATVLAMLSSCAVAELLISRTGPDEFPRRGLRLYVPVVATAVVTLAASLLVADPG